MRLALLLIAFWSGLTPQVPPLPELALTGFPDAARESLARAHAAAAARPSDPEAAGAFGRALHAWEQWDAAHAAYSRAAALAPRAFEWPYLDAVVLQRLARHADAVARLRTALTLRPYYLPARIRLAEALLDTGEHRESRTMFETLIREPAAEPAAQVGLGRIASAEGRHADAIAHFDRAIALFPELGAAHYALAKSYRAAGRVEDARHALEKHAQFGARWPRIDDGVLDAVSKSRSDGRAMLAKAVASAGRGEIDTAIAEHEAALELDPSLTQAHANLVSLYGRAKNWAKAEEHVRAAVAAGVATADVHYDHGIVLSAQERWDEAAAAYRRAIDVNPLHPHARNNLGQLLERNRDFAGAEEQYRRAIAAQPGFRLARFNLGRMLVARNALAEAQAELEALQQPEDAESPRYVFALATVYVRSGKRDEGVRLATRAKELALQHGQPGLAEAIERELARLK